MATNFLINSIDKYNLIVCTNMLYYKLFILIRNYLHEYWKCFRISVYLSSIIVDADLHYSGVWSKKDMFATGNFI